MLKRYVCIHGHFYQPPRENPWLEAVELQDSAYPYHDWNERITAECYAPNAWARILDSDHRIARLVNNYARISFNFGPTLLAWLQDRASEVYEAILAADRESQERFSGHGSALAQAYNHAILPLASRRDKVTQVRWGLRDFEARFGRRAEGMWLPETAVDLETLEVLAEAGVKFTILAPHQAGKVRKLGEEEWRDVGGSHIDPTTAYVQNLPSGRSIVLFFYDGPISRALAFEKLLLKAENLVNRLYSAFAPSRDWPQLVHIATDGESYGHHHPHGDMALAFALQQIESDPEVQLTNYGEYLELHPPEYEVQIIENTSWSCLHGIERWRSDCGCNSGRVGWNQAWRQPLREALDWLRDRLEELYEEQSAGLLRDPWAARDDYIKVILDRSRVNAFLDEHAGSPRGLTPEQRSTVLKLLESQRQGQLMYTSCGWFFDELSGLEGAQVLSYAGRALQLAGELLAERRSHNGVEENLEDGFLERLARAPSNIPEFGDGRSVYDRLVRPLVTSWESVGAHYAVSCLFESYPERAAVFCYNVDREDFQAHEAGKTRLVAGRVRVTSTITEESRQLCFAALHLGDHNVNAGVRDLEEESYRELVGKLADAYARAEFPEVVRLMDRGFGESTYSLRSLFRDERRNITKRVLRASQSEIEAAYRKIYEQHLPTMRFLITLGVPLPSAFQNTAEFLINTDLRWALDDDEPDVEHVRGLLRDAQFWSVKLDAATLAYRFKRMIGRVAGRLRERPFDLALVQTLTEVVELTRGLPFEVDLWNAQNVYWETAGQPLDEFLSRGWRGEESARTWLEAFVTLGDRLGVRTVELQRMVSEMKNAPTLRDLLGEIQAGVRVPRATYRVQFTPSFTFAEAQALVPYLHRLGISDLYVSPILRARPGSPHGYDVCDHSRLNPELGGEEAFEGLTTALSERGMGLMLDVVPNHMGIGRHNQWWMDVLENGPSSLYAHYFDVDWHPVNPNLENKVLLPMLGDQYGTILERGELKLAYENGAFFVDYWEHRLPVAPRGYVPILEEMIRQLGAGPESEDEDVLELRSIITALTYLPPRTELPHEKRVERNREKEIVKRRLAALHASSDSVRQALAATLRLLNGTPGDSRSFDRLDQILADQSYRPAYWRVASEEINYRRFFDVNELAAIRVEEPEVFQATHQLVFDLLAQGKATGLRIDHPDGLWDPAGYFRQLQAEYLTRRAHALLGERAPADLRLEVEGFLHQCATSGAATGGRFQAGWPLYVVAEKILGEHEPLPLDWAVHGTTGYDFLNAVCGVFVDSAAAEEFTGIYTRFIGRKPDFSRMMVTSQRMILRESMTSELNALGHMLDRISERNRRYRDFTLNSLTLAVREVITCLFIYRTYVRDPENVAVRDRTFIEAAVNQAREENPRLPDAIFDFVRDVLLLRNLQDFREEDRPWVRNWVMKFQQLTGPVIAKALEDTVFYTYNRLVSLNEVGGHPEQFGLSPADFHRVTLERARDWPHSLLTTSTHDTKRSEDVRARLNVLSELPQEWADALGRWSTLNADKRSIVDRRPAPDPNDEYLLYQTLLGTWPAGLTSATMPVYRERIVRYMQKAIKEAKVRTSWINPNAAYDSAVTRFVETLLSDNLSDAFLADFLPLQRKVAWFGWFNSLAQVVLKATMPGVPDFYQGTELWDFSLVDPDNRRPVDFKRRRELLDGLLGKIEASKGDLKPLVHELLSHPEDDRLKLFVTERVLGLRRRHEVFFRSASYVPLEAGENALGFARLLGSQAVLVVVPRLLAKMLAGEERLPLGEEVWQDRVLGLPEDLAGQQFRNLFTGELLMLAPRLPLARVFAAFPVAVLEPLIEEPPAPVVIQSAGEPGASATGGASSSGR